MELRLYTFCNFYLSQIQGGIQSAHLVHELFNKYQDKDPLKVDHYDRLADWSMLHKTMIVLNGGPNEYIKNRWLQFQRELGEVEEQIGHPLPWASFNEDQFSLGGVMTVVGVVLPDAIFNAVDYRTANNSAKDGREFSLKYDINRRDGWYFLLDADGNVLTSYEPSTATSRLIADVKSCRLF